MSQTPDSPPREADELVSLVYDELRRVAAFFFRRQPAGFTLRPTELVNEACLHLLRQGGMRWDSPEHFRAVATRKIWQVLVDHLRRRQSRKRGGGGRSPDVEPEWHRVPLESVRVEWRDGPVDLLDLAEALETLAAESPRRHEVVMLHWFGGLTYAEVARCLGVSPSTAEKDFRYALAWLNRWLSRSGTHAT